MKSATILLFCLAVSLPAHAQESMTITRNGSLPSIKGPEQYFTGSARIELLFQPKAPSRTTVGSVTFEPRARSAWHSHPAGQLLIVTAGTGWIQQEGRPKQEIRPGDVIWTPPGVKHWHGATERNAMTHLAITDLLNGRNVDWLEKVTDEDYLR